MSFLSTRAATFTFLLGFPLVHAFACSSPVRDYGMDQGATGGSNAGASAKGGASTNAGRANQGGTIGTSGGAGTTDAGIGGDAGAGTGGTGTGGIAEITGGAGGEPGSGGTNAGGRQGGPNGGTLNPTGGIPGTNSGGMVGLAGSGGTPGPGSGGAVGTGGAVGNGGTPSTCTPTGTEICNDGKDNDCNGFIDCVLPTGAFPEPNGAAAGKDVMITVNAPAITNYTFQCRSARGLAVPETVGWVACPSGSNLRVMPRTATESQDAASDGLWTTQVRAAYATGGASDPISLTYYMHHTLHTAKRCEQRATDQAFFKAAEAVVADAGVFGTTTIARSPFIQLGFTPPVSTHFFIAAGQGMTKLMSLRRRFFRRADDRYMIMTRTYASSRSGVCDAIDLRTHAPAKPLPFTKNRFYFDDCEAVVFNKAGAGVCLYVDTQGAVQKRTSHVDTYLRATGFSPAADNFFWRKLFDKHTSSLGKLVHFTPKCTTAGCDRTPGTIFLPDRDKFPYF